MWCPRCHTEVAAEIAQNGQSLLCTSCGTEIQRIYAPSLHPDTRSARELLERWSKSELLDVPSSTAQAGDVPASMVPAIGAMTNPELPPEGVTTNAAAPEIPGPLGTTQPSQPATLEETPATDESTRDTAGRRDRPERSKPERPTPKPRTTWRVDAAHAVTQPVASSPAPVPPRRPHFTTVSGGEAAERSLMGIPPVEPQPPSEFRPTNPLPITTDERVDSERHDAPRMTDTSEPSPVTPQPVAATNVLQRRLDPAHESLGGPHFDLQAFLAQDHRKPGKSESIWGQVLAYAGVGLITVGTTLVLWGWFGDQPRYAPTGWLICTVGQMLLFLGVITLISGGMQQTSHEVTRRVEYLGDRILRFEHSAEQLLRGPHHPEIRERARSEQASQSARTELDA